MAAPACEPHPPRRGGGVGEVRGHLFTRVSGSGPRASWVLSLLGWGGGGGGGVHLPVAALSHSHHRGFCFPELTEYFSGGRSLCFQMTLQDVLTLT